MSVPHPETAADSLLDAAGRAPMSWLTKLAGARAAIGVLVGVAVTFTQVHDQRIGLLALALYTLLTAITMRVVGRGALIMPTRLWRALLGVYLVVGVASATVATMLFVSPDLGDQWSLVAPSLVVLFGLGTGALEILGTRASALRHAGNTEPHTATQLRDLALVGGFSLVLAAVFALSPLLGIADEVSHTGFFGAYAIIVGVWLGISAATQWARPERKDAA